MDYLEQGKYSIDKARRLLDYEPSTTLREGLEAEVAWLMGEV